MMLYLDMRTEYLEKFITYGTNLLSQQERNFFTRKAEKLLSTIDDEIILNALVFLQTLIKLSQDSVRQSIITEHTTKLTSFQEVFHRAIELKDRLESSIYEKMQAAPLLRQLEEEKDSDQGQPTISDFRNLVHEYQLENHALRTKAEHIAAERDALLDQNLLLIQCIRNGEKSEERLSHIKRKNESVPSKSSEEVKETSNLTP